MKLTKQHVRILEHLSIHSGGETVKQIGLRNKRPLQTLNGHGLVCCGGQYGEKWYITDAGYKAIQ